MTPVEVVVHGTIWDQVEQHLLPREAAREEAAFLFARHSTENDTLRIAVFDVMLLGPAAFVAQSAVYLELADDVRAAVIKRAHDLNAGLIEVHSHPLQSNACFSASDVWGFGEFVPHVMRRLRRRPYGAIVVARHSLDALVWTDPSVPPTVPSRIDTEDQRHLPSGQTLKHWSQLNERESL